MSYSDPLSQFIQRLAPEIDVFTQIQLREPWGLTQRQGERGRFCYLRRGRCVVEVVGEPSIELQQGQMVLLPYGDAYRVSSELGVGCQFVSELFDDKTAEQVSQRVVGGEGEPCDLVCGAITFAMIQHWGVDTKMAKLPKIMVIDIQHSERLSRYVEWIYQENSQRPQGYQLALNHLLDLMMLDMIRGLPALDINPSWLCAINDRYLTPAVLAVQQDYRRDWRLEELAAVSALSRSAFADRFKRMTGTTAQQYLRQWRCFIAAQKLAETDLSIQQIAFECGFQSSDVLIRNFKQFHQVTPKQYRIQHQQLRSPRRS
ncbi:AraC family transcriptional regulator [Motilimonas eburnea]|uniref:AraC family transcriptional regulator n=1 Tax=Motilimonas eburnea TaxID=1737488 RepID=UPI001E3E9EF4|nr:AraC family transcriptional regulator [Motilimonas eburnea]MCE2571107.1 AraC family transcriptional regulator [Motilimonas eburnea]